MIKTICTLLILCSFQITNAQTVTLVKNNHPKARELDHYLNRAKDSLIIGSENKISKIEIFNEDFEKSTTVNGYKSQIPLSDLPLGNFVVEVKLSDKIILIDLIKHSDNSQRITKLNNAVEGKGMMLDANLNLIKSAPKRSIECLMTRTKKVEKTELKPQFFWVVAKINTESGANKTMKLVNKETVDKMIFKHTIELNSASGRLNELTIWEVYDTAKFMSKQMLDSNYFSSTTSHFFNTTPYFSTHKKLVNL